MNLNPDTLIKIIIAAEKTNEWLLNIPELTEEEFTYHAKHLIDNNFAEGSYDTSSPNQIPAFAIIRNLTLTGHELVTASMDETLWIKAKETVIKPAASWTVGILFEYLKGEVRQRIGI